MVFGTLRTLKFWHYKGVDDCCTVLVNITAYFLIVQQFKVVHLQARRLNSTNHRACLKYNQHLEEQMSRHRMVKQLTACEKSIVSYPTSDDDRKKMQGLDTQMEEMQRRSEHQCGLIYSTEMEFSEPIQHYHLCRRAYQGLHLFLNRTANIISNEFCMASW